MWYRVLQALGVLLGGGVCVHGAAQTPPQWHNSEQCTLNIHEAGGWCHVRLSMCDVHAVGQGLSLFG